MKICNKCVVPLEEKLSSFLPKNSLPFHYDLNLCDACYSLEKDPYYNEYFSQSSIFYKELEDFLDSRDKVVFAYSGGLDSTVVLDLLKKECDKRKITLKVFTIDHGFKGRRVKENIENVIEYEGSMDNFEWVDISQRKFENTTIFDYYASFYKKKQLPCGKPCNTVMNMTYKEMLDKLNENVLITGGDTPKYNKNLGRFSIFWEKKDFIVLRGGAAFGLNKKYNRSYIEEHSIPWKDPGCGGYDTDCLLPGAILRYLMKKKKYSLEELIKEIPVIIEYFSERVRWGIFERDDALKQMKIIDIADDWSYNEIENLVRNKSK